MKRTIRRCTFETNSSSMHSLVITKNDNLISKDSLKENMYLNEDGTWKIWIDDDLVFGRTPFQCLTTFESKVRYAIASLCCGNDKAAEQFEEIKQIVLEAVPECTNIRLPAITFRITKMGRTDNEVYYGSVDENILSGFLEKENISLKEFLLNAKYQVIVDGDEYCIYDSLKKSGLINKEIIVSEYPERN